MFVSPDSPVKATQNQTNPPGAEGQVVRARPRVPASAPSDDAFTDCAATLTQSNDMQTHIMKTTIILSTTVLLAAIGTARAADPPAELKEVWEKQCVKCHGAEGKGDTKMGKKIKAADFTDPKVQEKFTDEQMFKAIKEGVKDEEGKIKMKAAESVTDDQIKMLVRYVRTLKK